MAAHLLLLLPLTLGAVPPLYRPGLGGRPTYLHGETGRESVGRGEYLTNKENMRRDQGEHLLDRFDFLEDYFNPFTSFYQDGSVEPANYEDYVEDISGAEGKSFSSGKEPKKSEPELEEHLHLHEQQHLQEHNHSHEEEQDYQEEHLYYNTHTHNHKHDHYHEHEELLAHEAAHKHLHQHRHEHSGHSYADTQGLQRELEGGLGEPQGG